MDQAIFLLMSAAMPLLLAVLVLRGPLCRFALAIAPYAAVPALLLSIVSLVAPGGAAWQAEVPWLLFGSRLGIDAVSQVFLFFTSILWLAGGIYAYGYLAEHPHRRFFWFCYLLAMSGNLGLILAQDIAQFYFWFAVMSFSSYGLVIFTGSTEARRAGLVYIALTVFGEFLLFAGLVLAAYVTDSWLLSGLGDRLFASMETHGGLARVGLALAFCGLGVKAGLLPLHVWLPLAHPAAPVPASAVLSGAMIKAGLLGWLRLMPSEWMELGDSATGAAEFWAHACIALGLAAAFFAALVGVTQSNDKTVLAYSSISQMGLITISFGLAILAARNAAPDFSPTLAYAMSHGLAKGALFLGVGVAFFLPRLRFGWLWLTLGLALPAAALAGLPLTSGALAKGLLKYQIEKADAASLEWLTVLLPFAAIGTTLLMARLFWLLLQPGRDFEIPPKLAPMIAAWLALIVASCVATLAWPWETKTGLAKLMLAPDKLLAATWPVAVGVALAVLAILATKKIRSKQSYEVPVGDLLWLLNAGAKRARSLVTASRANWLPPPALTTSLRRRWGRFRSRLRQITKAGELSLSSGPILGLSLQCLLLALLLLFLLQ